MLTPLPPSLSSIKKLPPSMGFPVRAIVAVLWTTQLASLGLVAVTVYQQQVLITQLKTLADSDSTVGNERKPAKRSGSGGEDPWDLSYTANGSPKIPEVGPLQYNQTRTLGVLGTGSLLSLVGLLTLVLLVLLGLGKLWIVCLNQRRAVSGDLAGSPSNQQQLARRQLAEIRLRKHGFGQ